jgi:hypothetical protein
MERRLVPPSRDRDLPPTVAFALLFLLPAATAVLALEGLRLAHHDLGGEIGTLMAFLLAPGVVTALVSRWVCNRLGIEDATTWSGASRSPRR